MPNSTFGAVIIIIALLVYALCYLLKLKNKATSRFSFRKKDKWLRDRISGGLEKCAPVHMNIGCPAENDLSGGAIPTAMETTATVSSQMAFSDEPWVISCGNGTAVCLEKDAVKAGLDAADYGNELNSDGTQYAGYSPASQQAAAMNALDSEPASLHLNIGAFGSATILQDMAFGGQEGICIAGDDLTSQAAGLISADQVYIGEQLFELPETLDRKSNSDPALIAMDVLRVCLGVVILFFVIVGLSGI